MTNSDLLRCTRCGRPAAEPDKFYGRWAFFDDYARDDIRQTAEELSGRKRIPLPAAAAGRR